MIRSFLFLVYTLLFALFLCLAAHHYVVPGRLQGEGGARHVWDGLNDIMLSYNVSEATREALYHDYFYDKFHSKRIETYLHVALGILWAVSSLVNIWTGPPRGTILRRLHKYSGYIYLAACVLSAIFTPHFLWNGTLSRNVLVGEGTALVIAVTFALKAYLHLRSGHYFAHGQAMTVSAAGMWIIFVERPLFLVTNWVAFSFLGVDLDRGGPYEYRQAAFGYASMSSAVICTSFAAWRAYYDMPRQRKQKMSTLKEE